MREITQKMLTAFLGGKNFKGSNTEVKKSIFDPSGETMDIYLFGNLIARKDDTGINICCCGWFSNTTKERLNALPGVHIHQKNWQWYLNGKKWGGQWVNLAEWEKTESL